MNPDKIADIILWHRPKNVHEVQQFLGLCGYCRRYVKNYAQIASPLHEMTKLVEQFLWTEERDAAFEQMKLNLTTAPILAMSQDTGSYTLDVDASNWAAGAVLQQEQDGLLRVIGYASKVFIGTEKRYCITRKELAAMVFGLKHYRQYLLGRKFVIRTDHAALSYLMTAKDLIGQQARWVNLMSEFDFTIQHRAGVSHTNADALSRKIPSELDGVNFRQCQKHIRDSFDVPDNLVCNNVRIQTPRLTPEGPGSHPEVIHAKPVRTRAQARLESESTNIEAPTLLQPTRTVDDAFDVELDHWIYTVRVQIGAGDITHQAVKVIVNPANSHLNHFGGVAA